ncbi:CHASE3 domain-containing protein [Dokdonella sp.]|uniref:CHASE3 domain-containing protein n=1 Tax=Dokdonella sp. TaxID=2291710 RepID=UPI0037851C3F
MLAAILAVVAARVYRTVGDLVDTNESVNHTHQVKEQIIAATATLLGAEAAQRAYMIGGHADRLAEVYAALPQLPQRTDRLRGLVADNPEQSANAARFATVLEQRRQMIRELLDVFQQGGLGAVRSDTRFALAQEQDALVDLLSRRMDERAGVRRRSQLTRQAGPRIVRQECRHPGRRRVPSGACSARSRRVRTSA